MNTTTYRGVVKGGAIVLDDGVNPMPDGTEVIVTPIAAKRGTAAAILAAVNAGPRVSPEDIRELERAIEAGRRPLAVIEPFAPELPSDSS